MEVEHWDIISFYHLPEMIRALAFFAIQSKSGQNKYSTKCLVPFTYHCKFQNNCPFFFFFLASVGNQNVPGWATRILERKVIYNFMCTPFPIPRWNCYKIIYT